MSETHLLRFPECCLPPISDARNNAHLTHIAFFCAEVGSCHFIPVLLAVHTLMQAQHGVAYLYSVMDSLQVLRSHCNWLFDGLQKDVQGCAAGIRDSTRPHHIHYSLAKRFSTSVAPARRHLPPNYIIPGCQDDAPVMSDSP